MRNKTTTRIVAAVIALSLLLIPTAPANAARCNEACKMKNLLVIVNPEWRAVPQKLIKNLTRDMCDVMDEGMDWYDLIDFTVDSGLTEKRAIELFTVAVVVRCPWNDPT